MPMRGIERPDATAADLGSYDYTISAVPQALGAREGESAKSLELLKMRSRLIPNTPILSLAVGAMPALGL